MKAALFLFYIIKFLYLLLYIKSTSESDLLNECNYYQLPCWFLLMMLKFKDFFFRISVV